MALESLGTKTAPVIDAAFKSCHDLLNNALHPEKVIFNAGEPGIWHVTTGLLFEDRSSGEIGQPAVIITIAVG